MTNIKVVLKKKIRLSKNDTLQFTEDLASAVNYFEAEEPNPFKKCRKVRCTLTDKIEQNEPDCTVMVSVSSIDYSVTKPVFVPGWRYKE